MDKITARVTTILNHPFLSWGTLPFSVIALGTVLGARQAGFRLIPFLLLYSFLLMTGLQERLLMKKAKQEFKYPLILNHLYMIAMVLILVLIWINVNWLIVGLFFLYLLFILVAYHPDLKMEQTMFYVILQLFFKVIIMNFIAYYLQTKFLAGSLSLLLVPIIFLFLSIILYRQKGMFHDDNSRFQYFVGLYYLPLIIGSYAMGTILIILLFNVQGVPYTLQIIFLVPMLILFALLKLRNFRIRMRTDNYLNLVLMATVVSYALIVQFPT